MIKTEKEEKGGRKKWIFYFNYKFTLLVLVLT